MTEQEKTQETSGGDWTLRGVDMDALFAASPISDWAIDAAARAAAHFDPSFPGWALYRRMVTGDALMDRQLEAWAILCARALARSEKRNGRPYVAPKTRGKPGWIAQAGRDALDYALFGRFPCGVCERADQFGVSQMTYQAIRDPIAGAIWSASQNYRAIIHCEFWRARLSEKMDGAESCGNVVGARPLIWRPSTPRVDG